MLKTLVLAALPQAWLLVVRVRLDLGEALSIGVMVLGGSFELLDVELLAEHWDRVVEEAVELLGPGEFVVPREQAFRVAVPGGGFASASR